MEYSIFKGKSLWKEVEKQGGLMKNAVGGQCWPH